MTWTEKLKTIWADPVWSKVIASAIIGLAVWLIGNSLGVWPSVESYFWSLIHYALESSLIPNWIILIGALSFLLFVVVILRTLWLSFFNWHAYTSDEFLGINWRWHWEGNEILGLIPFCPTCELEVTGYMPEYSEYQTVFHCDRCNTSLQSLNMEPQHIADRVIREIQRKVRTGEWRVAIKSRPSRRMH